MAEETLVLVHGLYTKGASKGFRPRRARAVAEHGEELGVRSYECVVTSHRALANRVLRLARGTARAVDAAEILEIDAEALRAALGTEAGRNGWQHMAGCATGELNPAACFTLLGPPRRLLAKGGQGQRVFWFGRGQSHLSDAEFAAHYTLQHGPLVTGYGPLIGLQRYTQVVAEESKLCQALQALGLGRAPAPVVFAELVLARPVLSLRGLPERRRATRAIATDEQRHVDFARSM